MNRNALSRTSRLRMLSEIVATAAFHPSLETVPPVTRAMITRSAGVPSDGSAALPVGVHAFTRRAHDRLLSLHSCNHHVDLALSAQLTTMYGNHRSCTAGLRESGKERGRAFTTSNSVGTLHEDLLRTLCLAGSLCAKVSCFVSPRGRLWRVVSLIPLHHRLEAGEIW